MRLSDDSLRGRKVISADGNELGAVAGLFISSADWRVESIRIELHGEIADRIGAARSLLHRGSLELPVSLIQSVGDAVVLAVDVESLREVHRPPQSDVVPTPPA